MWLTNFLIFGDLRSSPESVGTSEAHGFLMEHKTATKQHPGTLTAVWLPRRGNLGAQTGAGLTETEKDTFRDMDSLRSLHLDFYIPFWLYVFITLEFLVSFFGSSPIA